MTRTVLVLEHGFPDLAIERQIFDEAGLDVLHRDAATPESVISELRSIEPDVVGILTQYTELTSDVFEAAPKLDVVGRYGIGVDNVDVESATAHDVTVLNVPDYCIEEVATHTVGLLLTLARKIYRFDRSTRNGAWEWSIGEPISRLSEQTLGFVGFGKIPQRAQEVTNGLGFDHITYDPYKSQEELDGFDVEKVAFPELLARSDFISIHAPLTAETTGLFDGDAFARMQESAFLVNTSRGGIVDIAALRQALDDEAIAGAALDVLPEEPPDDRSLYALENVVTTPHVAWYSEESIVDLRHTLATDVATVLTGGPPENPINRS